MKKTNKWLEATRPKTLPAAIAPTLLGTAIAASTNQANPTTATLCVTTALLLQIACNLSNDYSDGIKGTDTNRIGPQRLVGSKQATPKQVLTAATITYLLAATTGITLTLYTQQLWLIPLGIISILASWYYTGGKNPYGYKPLGEIIVFLFFGLLATITTTYLQTNTITPVTITTATSIGLLSCAMLLINNIRDIETDKKANKNTLAVKLGENKSKALYVTLILIPLVIAITTIVYAKLSILTAITTILITKTVKLTLQSQNPKDLITVLKYTGQIEIIYTITLGIALVLKPITG